ncbi:hypothetical protein J7W16_14470 [Bacillus sp. YZJH907-2]|uniref:Uncharacterized protein n=2 Tax=Halalkalibacter suaedae TaxID=2822140 RepID=A0A940WV75_9BACI|nr:hypothetical protein [Bacillus suaedae]
MFALATMILLSSFLIPVILIVHEERLSNRQELEVLLKLEEIAHYYIAYGSIQFPKSNDKVTFFSEVTENGLVSICANWIGKNGREYEECLLAAR